MVERAPRLEGKVAIITGAGSSGEGIGNGKAAAILMAREGARVLLVDQVEDRAKETLQIIESEGGEASTFAGDMTKLDDCERMAQAAVDRYGRTSRHACRHASRPTLRAPPQLATRKVPCRYRSGVRWRSLSSRLRGSTSAS